MFQNIASVYLKLHLRKLLFGLGSARSVSRFLILKLMLLLLSFVKEALRYDRGSLIIEDFVHYGGDVIGRLSVKP